MDFERTSAGMGQLLLQGYTMLAEPCPVHQTVPLMRERKGKKCVCVQCKDKTYVVENGEVWEVGEAKEPAPKKEPAREEKPSSPEVDFETVQRHEERHEKVATTVDAEAIRVLQKKIRQMTFYLEQTDPWNTRQMSEISETLRSLKKTLDEFN